MEKFPFIITIPHGGILIPDELTNCISITEGDLFDDSDSFTQAIYGGGNMEMQHQVETLIKFDIARAFIDVGRPPDALPPQFPDGVIKSATCYNKPIYKTKCQPNKAMTVCLLKRYYHPFHAVIRQAVAKGNVKIGLDCHSMAAVAPAVAPDTGKRPLINLGDCDGQACDPAITRQLKDCFMDVFGFDAEAVSINSPFKGGYITKTYGNRPIPWIQIEMNKKLYLSKPWFNCNTLQVNPKRIGFLTSQFQELLRRFHIQLKEGRK